MPSRMQQRRGAASAVSIAEDEREKEHVGTAPKIVFVNCDRSIVRDVARVGSPPAVTLVDSNGGDWDRCSGATLAVVDVTPSGKLNLDALHQLKAVAPALRTVAVTQYPSIDLVVRVVQAGADHCLTQPVYLEELLHFAESSSGAPARVEDFGLPTLDRVEWEYIARVLAHSSGNISVAARILGIRRTTLQRKLKKYPAL